MRWIRATEDHPRAELATRLWPGTGDQHARQSLRQVFVRLRRVLGTHAILVADHHDVTFDGACLDIDAARFEALMTDSSVTALEVAATLYQATLSVGRSVGHESPFRAVLDAVLDAVGRDESARTRFWRRGRCRFVDIG